MKTRETWINGHSVLECRDCGAALLSERAVHEHQKFHEDFDKINEIFIRQGTDPALRNNYLLRGFIGPHEELYTKDVEFHTFVQMWTQQMVSIVDAMARSKKV